MRCYDIGKKERNFDNFLNDKIVTSQRIQESQLFV